MGAEQVPHRQPSADVADQLVDKRDESKKVEFFQRTKLIEAQREQRKLN